MDANFGTTSGIAEMLLVSQDGEIQLLPTIPSEGEIKGLCARGGFEIDMKWKNGELNYVKIKSKLGKSCKVRYKDKVESFDTEMNTYYYPIF